MSRRDELVAEIAWIKRNQHKVEYYYRYGTCPAFRAVEDAERELKAIDREENRRAVEEFLQKKKSIELVHVGTQKDKE